MPKTTENLMVEKMVLTRLGRPPQYETIKSTKVSEKCFRVNVYRREQGELSSVVRICDSFFVTVDTEDNRFIKSSPIIKRKYK